LVFRVVHAVHSNHNQNEAQQPLCTTAQLRPHCTIRRRNISLHVNCTPRALYCTYRRHQFHVEYQCLYFWVSFDDRLHEITAKKRVSTMCWCKLVNLVAGLILCLAEIHDWGRRIFQLMQKSAGSSNLYSDFGYSDFKMHFSDFQSPKFNNSRK
jgi:hypothetical protein